jgi:hypothetical protein
MGMLWVLALIAIFLLPAALLARLHVPPREHDPNNTSDAAIEIDRTKRHEWR